MLAALLTCTCTYRQRAGLGSVAACIAAVCYSSGCTNSLRHPSCMLKLHVSAVCGAGAMAGVQDRADQRLLSPGMTMK